MLQHENSSNFYNIIDITISIYNSYLYSTLIAVKLYHKLILPELQSIISLGPD